MIFWLFHKKDMAGFVCFYGQFDLDHALFALTHERQRYVIQMQ